MSENSYKVDADGLSRDGWSAALKLFEDATIYQTWDYAETVFPGQRQSRIAVHEGGEVVGMAQARIARVPVLGRGIAYVAWGPLWQRRDGQENVGVFARVLGALKEEYAVRRRLVLRVVPNVCDGDGQARETLEHAGFRGTDARPYRTFLLDISVPVELIRKGFAQKWRNCLNRAERNGLELCGGTSDVDYAEFLKIYDEMKGRKAFESGIDAGAWARLQRALPDGEKLRVLLARKDGKSVAGMVFSHLGRKAVYLLGATSEAGLKLQGSYLLQWRAIEMMRQAGCTLYDLGGIDPEANPGVYHFKEGLGGRDVSHVGTFEYCTDGLSRTLVAMGEAAGTLGARLGGKKSS